MTRTASQLVPGRLWEHLNDHHRRSLSNPWYRVVGRTQSSISHLTMDFWSQRGAQTLHLPMTTGSISSPMGLGSDSLPVKVDLLGAPTYLADSMQFALEFGVRLVGEDCYYLMPSFRGENADQRHLCQFYHSEAEIRGDLQDVMQVVQEYLVRLAQGLLERHADDISTAAGSVRHVEALAEGGCFRAVTFDQASELLGGEGVVSEDGRWRHLTQHGERLLMDKVGPFTWVTHWDHLAVPFYQAFADEDRRTATNADLLFGVGETVGAGQRHLTAQDVRDALAYHGVDEEPYRWYLEMREDQQIQTAGFGLGIERFLMWLLDHDDIRDFQLFPRINGLSVTP